MAVLPADLLLDVELVAHRRPVQLVARSEGAAIVLVVGYQEIDGCAFSALVLAAVGVTPASSVARLAASDFVLASAGVQLTVLAGRVGAALRGESVGAT